MQDQWSLEIKATDQGGAEPVEFRLIWENPKTGQPHVVVSADAGIEAFEDGLSRLRHRLAAIGEEARQRWEQAAAGSNGPESAQPEDLWQQLMGTDSDQGMFELFNAFGEETRMAVAEYVFTHVSMFSGKGAVFAQHYNAATHVLE